MAVIACDIYKLVFKKNATLTVLKSLSLIKGFELVEPIVPASSILEISEEKAAKLKEEINKLEKVITYLSQEGKEKPIITNKKVELALSEYEEITEKADELYKKLELSGVNNSLDKKSLADESKIEVEELGIELPEEILSSELVYQKLLKVENSRMDYITKEIESIDPLTLEIVEKAKDFSQIMLMSIFSDKEFVDKFVEKNHEGITVLESSYAKTSDEEETFLNEVETEKEISFETDLVLEQAEILYDLLTLEMVAYENARFVGEYSGEEEDVKTNGYFEITGWVDPDALPKLETLKDTLGGKTSLEKMPTGHRSDIRTKMHNNWFFRPFELVTQFMGVPGADEIDPSPVMSIFFVVFFGFALGDAGYGFLMLTGILAYMIWKKPTGAMKEALKLLAFCSISTIFFGALTGGWFGVNVDTLTGTFGSILQSMKVIDLQASILLVLGMSLAAGYIQQLFGVILEMVTYFKRKDVVGGLMGPGTWLLLLVIVPLVFLSGSIPAISFIAPYKNYILFAIIVVFAFGQGRNAKNFFLRPLIGLGSLFNLTGFLSNTLSYARLLALGLATGVIASVINLIAGIMGGTDSFVGIIVTVFILVIGHLFNIGLNVLGTFVNIVRLQLVEFFPRFFEAKGTALESIDYEPQYVKVPENLNNFGALFINISNLFITKQ